MIFKADVDNIEQEAFGQTKFTNIIYDGITAPKCSYDSFENDQIVNVSINYTSNKFCQFLIPNDSDQLTFSSTNTFIPSNTFTPKAKIPKIDILK